MKLPYPSVVAASLCFMIAALPSSAQSKVEAIDLVELFEKLGGKHPGFRKAHARGVCGAGVFTPDTSKQTLRHFTDAKLLSQGELPVAFRFSLGGADPNGDERTPGTRGAGIQISLPDGSKHIFTGNNFPVFAGKDPETFFGFLSTFLPTHSGVPDPSKTAEFIKNNPSVLPHVMWQKSAETPASYGNTAFFGLHTFYYNNPKNDKTKFRWHLQPELGVKTLNKKEAETKKTAFLATRLAEQLAVQEVSFSLNVSIGQEKDSDIDPSNQWPDDRTIVSLGKITVNQSGGDACKNTNFDPNMLSTGFEPSADPVLRMRSAAYAISFGKRLGNQ
jgi:catalase